MTNLYVKRIKPVTAVQWNNHGDHSEVYYRRRVGQCWPMCHFMDDGATAVIETGDGRWVFIEPGNWIVEKDSYWPALYTNAQFTENFLPFNNGAQNAIL